MPLGSLRSPPSQATLPGEQPPGRSRKSIQRSIQTGEGDEFDARDEEQPTEQGATHRRHQAFCLE
jgi:hypothetical protein